MLLLLCCPSPGLAVECGKHHQARDPQTLGEVVQYKYQAEPASSHTLLLDFHFQTVPPFPGQMAPSTVFMEPDNLLTPKEKNKLRKPVVEKMRRDRINSSIEQLKLLLEKEFQRHQPNSKLEKADILEMAVSYLKQQSQLQVKAAGPFHKSSQFDFREGYSRCLQEAFHFLSLHKVRTETQTKLLSHFQKSQSAATEVAFSPGNPSILKPASPKDASTLWRPW
ncbi:transcription factor HES-5-like [Pezoporus occidentalis]|uniref:transcription factor HES-5-like n=1 Tax=Pezoporus occidentalis TaxID=407982 RepID=UPI002F917263